MLPLSNIKLGYSGLYQTGKIMLYRHGKDPAVALEKREAEKDVMAVLVQYLTEDAPKGSTLNFTLGNHQYELTLKVLGEEGR
jgi:hypothetical protein